MIKQHKKTPVIAAMAFTTLLSQAAWANNEETTLSAPVFEADELSYAFEQSAEPMQMLALTEQEMKDTEGANVYWGVQTGIYTIGGGVLGAGTYAWNSYNTRAPMTWGGAGRAFGSGATAGFWSSPLVRFVTPIFTIPAGAFGAASWYNW